MNARPTAKQIAQTAVLNGHLIPAGGSCSENGILGVSNREIEARVKFPDEVGLQRTDAPKSPRRYVKRKPKLPLTPVTKNGKHLFIIYPK